MNKNIQEVNAYALALYQDKYHRTLSLLNEQWHLLGIDPFYKEDIAASLVLIVEAIRGIYVSNKKRIAFLLEVSSFICQSVKAKVIRYLSGYHELFFPSIEHMNHHFLEENQIDLFVTNYPEYLSYFQQDIDFVLYKSIPDMADWNHLLQQINPQMPKDFSLRTFGPTL